MNGRLKYQRSTDGIPGILRLILVFGPPSLLCISSCSQTQPGIEYLNPRVYNVDFTFELRPEPGTIERETDLRLWLPVPGEWDSQKAVRMVSVDPPPHTEYTDPEFGSRMFFWDFSRGSEQPVYSVNLRYRLESFDGRADIDPDRVGAYDKSDELYTLYTRSTEHIEISPEVEALARDAVGSETNPYWQAKRILDYVVEHVRYGWIRPNKPAGVGDLLGSAVVDEETGEQVYVGACNLKSEFFVALCRAVGIPARAVTGMVGWNPWMQKEDLVVQSPEYAQLSSDSLAAARLFGPFEGHRWAEFYLPNYGWIPVDPTWNRFAWIGNERVIFSKGTDVLIGPDAPPGDGNGYGEQWIPLRNGRTETLGWGVWNLARVRVANAKVVHHSDPFPADAFASYMAGEYTDGPSSMLPTFDGRGTLRRIDDLTRGESDQQAALAEAYEQEPSLWGNREQFLIHMLRGILGDQEFSEVYREYAALRLDSGEPVPSRRFQELAEEIHGQPLDWFFHQWRDSTALPQLRLEGVEVAEEGDQWDVRGTLRQPDDRAFRFPLELLITTERGDRSERISVDAGETPFELSIPDRPERIIVDPGLDLLKIQRMPPTLAELWKGWPEDFLVVYGTLAEGQANKAAAESFNRNFLGLNDEVLKADVDVGERDLEKRTLILFGRPETNVVSRRFADEFPVRFDGGRFTYDGMKYDKPTQGVAQVIENPWDPQGLIVLYAGLSGESTQEVCDTSEWWDELGGSYLFDLDASFVIYDRYHRLVSGDWEGFDDDLVWISNGPSGERSL